MGNSVGNNVFSSDYIFISQKPGEVNLLADKAAKKRNPTDYPGGFFVIGRSPVIDRDERVYYIRYRNTVRWLKKKQGGRSKSHDTGQASRLRAMKKD